MIRRTSLGTFSTNCGWGRPGLDYDKINAEAKKAARESARKLAFEVRAKELQKAYRRVLELPVAIALCRQIVKEQGAKKIDQLLKECAPGKGDDGTYETLKALGEKY